MAFTHLFRLWFSCLFSRHPGEGRGPEHFGEVSEKTGYRPSPVWRL